jgi:hypothetical protein
LKLAQESEARNEIKPFQYVIASATTQEEELIVPRGMFQEQHRVANAGFIDKIEST